MTQERPFVCGEEGCKALPDCPQLKDAVWYQIAGPNDLLCLRHAEERLGREIVPEDLAPCPANTYALALAERRPECSC